MAVSRIDILNHEFTRSLRGYNPEEVDNFLHDVADTLGRLGDEKVVLSSRVVQLEARLVEFEQHEAALRSTLMATQRMTEDLKSGAQREAQLIIDAARSRADNLLQQANQRLRRIFDEIAEAKKLKTQFEITVRSMVESHLKLLEMQQENENRLDAGVAKLGLNTAQPIYHQPKPEQLSSAEVNNAPRADEAQASSQQPAQIPAWVQNTDRTETLLPRTHPLGESFTLNNSAPPTNKEQPILLLQKIEPPLVLSGQADAPVPPGLPSLPGLNDKGERSPKERSRG